MNIQMLATQEKGMRTITVEAVTKNLVKVIDFVNDELESAGCGLRSRMQFDLAVEELFVNVAHYAYAPGTGDITISICFKDDPRAAEITVTDSGIPYNPLEKADPDTSLSAEDRKIGGLGIFMAKRAMDTMTYRYEDGCNIVTVSKCF